MSSEHGRINTFFRSLAKIRAAVVLPMPAGPVTQTTEDSFFAKDRNVITSMKAWVWQIFHPVGWAICAWSLSHISSDMFSHLPLSIWDTVPADIPFREFTAWFWLLKRLM